MNEYDLVDESYSTVADVQGKVDEVDDADSDEEYDEGELGYDIRVPENPLDTSLKGRYINLGRYYNNENWW